MGWTVYKARKSGGVGSGSGTAPDAWGRADWPDLSIHSVTVSSRRIPSSAWWPTGQ